MIDEIDTPSWTPWGWLWGYIGVFAAFVYMYGWYFIFAAPLMVMFAVLNIISGIFVEDPQNAMSIVLLVLSPFSLWFVFWQFSSFIGPSFLDIIRAVGFFLQRAHHNTPSSLIAIVRGRRQNASKQFMNVSNRLTSRIRRK